MGGTQRENVYSKILVAGENEPPRNANRVLI